MLKRYEPGGGNDKCRHEQDAGKPVRILGLGLGEQVCGADVCEHAPCDTGQETERTFTGREKVHGQSRGSRYRQPEQDRRSHDPRPSDARGNQDSGKGDPNGYLVNKDPEPDEPGCDSPCPDADTENEAVGEVVDGQPEDERPERVFVDMLVGQVVRVGPGEHLGHEQEGEPSNEPGDRSLSTELERLGEEVDECEREQYPRGEGGGVRSAPGSQLSTE